MVRIGIEIEILLEFLPTGPSAHNLNHFAGLLAEAFNHHTKGSIPMHASVHDDPGEHDLVEWTITDDGSLDTNRDTQWPIEIISPILEYQPGWDANLMYLWATLQGLCDVNTNETCGTHVHISPSGGLEWTPQYLKMLCYSIIHFEHAFGALLPEERRNNEYAKSNRYDNPRFLEKTSGECCMMIEACSSNDALADLMNNGGDRYFAWNFTNLREGGIMTVEFRRGPGVTSNAECLSWVELAVSFVQVACRLGAILTLEDYPPTVEGLQSFISKGLELESYKPQAMEAIFKGKSGFVVPTPIGPLSADKLEKLSKRKIRDDQRQIMVRKFLRLH